MAKAIDGTYTDHKKRKSALKDYLEKYKTLKKMTHNEEGKKLYNNFYSHKDDIYETAIELGYNLDKICCNLPNFYYEKHPERLKEKVWNFINKNNRFPTLNELIKDLNIDIYHIKDIGSIDKLKEFVGYNKKDGLIDLRGDANRSMGELLVANYFYSQGLKNKYLREQHPFPSEEGQYRSDFTFYLKNNKELHIEVWGFEKDCDRTPKHIEYNKIRKIKENLYEKYKSNIILIGIEYNLFENKYKDIQEQLYKIFSQYLDLKFKNVSYKKLLSPCIFSDKELYKEIMKASTEKNVFPIVEKLKECSPGIYPEILKRGYTYNSFAKKFNAKLKINNTEWNKDLIFKYFDEMISKNKLIDKDNMSDFHSNLYGVTNDYGYITKLKLEYFAKINYIPKQELNWFIGLASNNLGTTANFTNKEVLEAKRLLKLHYPIKREEYYCDVCGRKMIRDYIYQNICSNCLKIKKEKKLIFVKYNEKEYDDNFNKVTIEPYHLTTTGFNSVSDMKIQAYRNYFKSSWVGIVKRYNRFDELYNYIVEEYKKYIKETGNNGFAGFARKHKYITYDLLKSIDIDKIEYKAKGG